MKTYTFDLNRRGSERWLEVLNDNVHKKGEIRNFIKSLFSSYAIGLSLLDGLISDMKMKNAILYKGEIESIANFFDVSFTEILLLQLIYETSAACTVAMLNIMGNDFYFRTLDWRMDFLKKITIGLNIVKDGRIIGSAVTWIGYIGFTTCSVRDEYNIALNYRNTKPLNSISLSENVYKIVKFYWPITYLIRTVLENELSYEDAVNELSDSLLVSPCYISVYSKHYKSVIITRDSESVVSLRDYDLVQTNCDFDKCTPNISNSVERKKLVYDVEKMCNEYNITSYDEILSMLLKYPVLNQNTIYYVSEYMGEKRIKVMN